jgi:signal transduction histidine kinase
VWRARRAPDASAPDAWATVTGFETSSDFIAAAFASIVKHAPLLPPSLAPGRTPNELLTVRVSSKSGQVLYASSDAWSEYASQAVLEERLGALRLEVALKPGAAGTLVIGGLPHHRLPLLAGLLALTIGLITVALVQLRREHELARVRSDFVSGVSHELRTPLAQIRMFTETLLLGRVRSEAEGRRSLEIVARETQRLTQLVENVLFFSRAERTAPRLVPEATGVDELVREVIESFEPIARAREARVSATLAPAIVARVDPGAVRQVLLNLLDNAVKYGPPGQSVHVGLEAIGDEVCLSVTDEGPGIPEQDVERVWEPFCRLARPESSPVGGTGIGLTIVRQLVELHGGRVSVGPGITRGARFLVWLPGGTRQSRRWSTGPKEGTAIPERRRSA